MYRAKALILPIAAVGLLTATPLKAEEGEYRAAVFALLDSNEWCPGGSVYLDLESGSFLLHPRPTRERCFEPGTTRAVERGTLGQRELSRVRTAYLDARRAGLKRQECDLIISNGGPMALAITAPGFSAATPEELGCWSDEANAFHDELFKIFGEQRGPQE